MPAIDAQVYTSLPGWAEREPMRPESRGPCPSARHKQGGKLCNLAQMKEGSNKGFLPLCLLGVRSPQNEVTEQSKNAHHAPRFAGPRQSENRSQQRTVCVLNLLIVLSVRLDSTL